MANSIGLWAVDDGRLLPISAGQVDRERRLEDWIESHPDILGERLLLVGRQVQTAYGGIIDLLAVDNEGRCVVIELKRGRTPRDIVAQALDYVSWVSELQDTDVRDRIARMSGLCFNDAYRNRFGEVNTPEKLNTDQRILIVATDIDGATTRIVEYLTRRYGIDVNVVALSYFKVGEQELLARTWTVDPTELAGRIESRASEPLPMNSDRPWTGLWHFNIGEGGAGIDAGVGRNWSEERRYGFLSCGQGATWRDEILKLRVGDKVYAYLNGAGYVGGGVIDSEATRADSFVPPGSDKLLRELPLETQGWFLNCDDPDLAEYMVGVNWSRTVDPSEGVRVSPAIRGTVRKIWNADLADRLIKTFG